MRAIRIKNPGGVEVLQLEECERPTYGDNDILIQVKAAGINFIDIYTRTGLYKYPHPYTPGKEGSGIVVAIGKNVKHFKNGDRVAFCSPGTGSYAEFTAIPADQVVSIPDSVTFETAAAAMLQGLTAYYLSHLTFSLNNNHVALVHAGAGGVGLLLIQMAKLVNAKVIATVSSQEKATLTQSFGADKTIIYTEESFLAGVMKITDQRGVNVVYDSVGKTTFDDSLKSLALRGMLVTYGQSSGPIPAFELTRLAEKSLYITRPTLMHYTATPSALNEMAKNLFDLIEKNKLKITIGQRYGLNEVAEAHTDLESRKTTGKSIIVI